MDSRTPKVVLRSVSLRLFVAAMLLMVGCGGSDILVPLVGDLEIITATGGTQMDADGYEVTIDAGTAAAIGPNATLRRDNLEPGIHSVQLGGVADHCSVSADNPRAVNVPAGQTTSITFSITCISPTGGLEITTVTSGSDTDADGYDVTIDAGTADPIGANATLRHDNLEPGNHSVRLGGVANGCSVAGDNPRSVSVTDGQSTTITFTLTCAAPVAGADPGPLVNLGTGPGRIWGWSNSGLFVGSVGGVDGGQSHAAIWQNHVVRDISRVEWGMSEAYAVNDAGQVVGEYTSITGMAFLWENGVVTDLGTHDEQGWSTATAINSSGVVAGTSSVCTSCGRATIWDHGQTIDVGTLPSPWDRGSKAVGINDLGQVIGISGGDPAPLQSQRHAFVWHDGIMVDLGALRPGDDIIEPLAINNRGQIIGNSSNAETYRPFIWENGVMRALLDPQGRVFFPDKLNDDGIVYGKDWDGDRALWQDGRVLKLSAHPGSGGWEDNDLGEVLGGSDDQPAVWIIDRATVVHHVP